MTAKETTASERKCRPCRARPVSWRYAVLAACVSIALPAGAADPSIQVSVNRNEVFLGESVLLEIRLGGESDPAAPDLSGIRNATVQPLGSRGEQRTFTTWVNGQLKVERFKGRVFQYELMPAAAGEFRAGPIVATVDNRTLRDVGPTIRVHGVEEQDLVKVTIEASRTAVLVDESFTIALVVSLRTLPGQWSTYDPLDPRAPPKLDIPYLDNQSVPGLNGPDPRSVLQGRLVRGNSPGFAINNYTMERDLFSMPFFGGGDPFREAAKFHLDRKPATRDGKPCMEYRLSLTYRPRKEASHTFGPVIFKGDVFASVTREGRPLSRTIYAIGPAVVVRVIPPPEEGRPPSFVGVVGSNLAVRASLDAQTCSVGDPLTLTLALTGQANLENAFPPDLSILPELTRPFRVYMDTAKTETRDGARLFTYMVRPSVAGTIELPAIPVSYYDVASRSYCTVRSDPIPVRVNESPVLASTSILIEGRTNEPALVTSRSLPVAPPDTTAAGWTAAASWFPAWTPMIVAGSLALFLAALAVRPIGRAARLLGQQACRAAALRRALSELRAAASHAPGSADRAAAALQSFCRDRFGLAEAGTLTPSELADALTAAGVTPGLAGQFRSHLEALARIRFGANATDRDVGDLLRDMEQDLRELDRSAR
jgi:hypothetical protein